MFTLESMVQCKQVRIFVDAGVTKLRLTGGEPTLRRDIVELTARLRALPGLQDIGITTNGIALKRKLQDLRDNGLNLLNMSLDTLQRDRFERMARRQGLERVLETIDAAIELGFDPVKARGLIETGALQMDCSALWEGRTCLEENQLHGACPHGTLCVSTGEHGGHAGRERR